MTLPATKYLALYSITFLSALVIGLPLYIGTLFLSTIVNVSAIPYIYLIGYLVGMVAVLNMANIIEKYHKRFFYTSLYITISLVCFAIAFSPEKEVTVVLFICYLILTSLLYGSMSLIAEGVTRQEKLIGHVRGTQITIFSFGILASPFLAASFTSLGGYNLLFAATGILAIPMIFFANQFVSHTREAKPKSIHIINAIKKAFDNTDLRGALFGLVSLELFYSVMVIFGAVLVVTKGFDLITYLSVVLPIALLPLVILPHTLGAVADNKFGEKEMMIVGMIIISLSLVLFILNDSKSLYLLTGILLFSRIGASMLETMVNAYYFKKIDQSEVALNSVFVATRFMSISAVAVIAILMGINSVENISKLFIVIAVIIFFLSYYVFQIKDTK